MPHADRESQSHHHNQKQSRTKHKQGNLVPRRREKDVDPLTLWEKRRAQLFRERKILMVVTVLCCLATAVWIAALSTDYWIVVDSVHKNSTLNDTTTVLKSHLGVWRGCVRNRHKNDFPVGLLGRLAGEGCSYHNLEEDDYELRTLPAVAKTIVDYRRTIVALGGLSLLCHVMAISVSFYTFRNGRYTFKRLAGAMHFMTAATVLVLIEVVSNGADYAKSHLLSYFPVGSVWYHGFSYYLAWLVFAQFVAAGLTFLILSKKKKSLNIVGEDGNILPDDEVQFMGRL